MSGLDLCPNLVANVPDLDPQKGSELTKSGFPTLLPGQGLKDDSMGRTARRQGQEKLDR
jgi:hypothetical protein